MGKLILRCPECESKDCRTSTMEAKRTCRKCGYSTHFIKKFEVKGGKNGRV